jgi:hypothetical protein
LAGSFSKSWLPTILASCGRLTHGKSAITPRRVSSSANDGPPPKFIKESNYERGPVGVDGSGPAAVKPPRVAPWLERVTRDDVRPDAP